MVAPILASRVHYIASDIDQEREEAQSGSTGARWGVARGPPRYRRAVDPNVALGAIENECACSAPTRSSSQPIRPEVELG